MKARSTVTQFVLCIKNDGYSASLERRKIYQVGRGKNGEGHALLSVIDESGEAYLYPVDFFVPLDLPAGVVKALKRAA